MSYEQFELLIESYLGFEAGSEPLSDEHHLKKYVRRALDPIKTLDAETQSEYFERYIETNRPA